MGLRGVMPAGRRDTIFCCMLADIVSPLQAQWLASLLMMLLAVAGSPALAAPPVLPPLNDPPTGHQIPGKFVWADLVAPDIQAARRFYRKMFGWSYRTLDGDGRPYTLASVNGQPVAGMIQRREEQTHIAAGRWVGFVSVADVAAASRYTLSKGGKVLVEPHDLPARGEMAILADPDEVPIGVITSASGDRDDFLVEEGEWVWALYQSPAAASAAAFYQDLAGYEIVSGISRYRTPHFLLVAQGYLRASVLEIPVEDVRVQPGWLYFIRVDDVQRLVAKAGKLGGRVLITPRDDLLRGRLAVIADPGGAPVGLLEWQPQTDADQP